jgi:hypothetical protein
LELIAFSFFYRPVEPPCKNEGIADFAFPHDEYTMTQGFQLSPILYVSSTVGFELLEPEVDARLRQRGVSAVRMAMPKTSMNEDNGSILRKDDVRTSR